MSYDIDITNTPPAHEPERQYYYMAKAKDFVEKKSKEIGRPMTYFVKTFGCQMNARDSEKLVGILEQIGYVEGTDEHSDFIVYNTCTVRGVRQTWVSAELQEKESSDEDRSVRLHDAGAGGC